MNGKTQKKGFHMPHVFIILLVIMLFVVILSYLIPSGLYERIEDASGITVIDPDTFQYVENETPITFMDYFEAVYTGFCLYRLRKRRDDHGDALYQFRCYLSA